MPNERKYFGDTSFRTNADDAHFAVGLNEVVNLENLRSQTTDTGVTGVLESIGSNAFLTQDAYSDPNDIEIGTFADSPNNRFVKCIYNPNPTLNRITCVYPNIPIEYVVLLGIQIPQFGLPFNPNFPIHSGAIINGYFYWVNSTNSAPQKVNIESGIKLNNPSFVTNQVAYVNPVLFSEITLIKPPPIYAPTILKAIDLTTDLNLINIYSFEFAFQYIYWDNETSVVGVYSVGSRLNFAFNTSTLNSIVVTMATNEVIPNTVRIVNLVCRFQDGSPEGGNIANVIFSWDKVTAFGANAIANQNNASVQLSYVFYNTSTGQAIATDDVLRGSDSVPLFSGTLATAKDRLFLGNNIEGLPTPPSTSMGVTENSAPVPYFVAPFNYSVFLSNAAYNCGIQFYDFAQRPIGGVVTNPSLSLKTPQYVNPLNIGTPFSAVVSLSWTLSNASAALEIPIQAYYYSPVRTLNLRTRSLITTVSTAPRYATLDANGNYVFTSTVYSNNVVALALDTSSLVQAKLGYIFTAGDACTLWGSPGFPGTYEVSVIAQSGGYILVGIADTSVGYGNLSAQYFQFQIYTPYKSSINEPYFQVGQIFTISNVGASNRTYGTLSGTFAPDSYLLLRISTVGSGGSVANLSAAMSPNDAYYKRWDSDGGKLTVITNLGQANKITYIRFSDTFVANTAINGLSTFRDLNEGNTPQNGAAISRLILVNKIENAQGSIMLAICAGGQTYSIYLGETQITDNTGVTQFFTSQAAIVGTINQLKGSKGTINPESVVEYRGDVWWFDANNGEIIQYSNNGLDVPSQYKMQRFWSQWAQVFLSLTPAQFTALGSRPFIFATVDTKHKEVLFTIPKLANYPPKGYLPDYPSTIYPFDILDLQAKTIVYKLGVAERLPHWQGAYTFYTENFVTLQNKLFSFNKGITYQHNQTNSFCNFYGVQYMPKLMCVANQFPQVPKVYNNISIEANILPNLVYMYCIYPIQQSSDLVDFDFSNRGQSPQGLEGVLYATIYRNKLTPTATGFNSNGLLTNEKMRNKNMLIMIQFVVGNTALNFQFISVGFQISEGHNNEIQK